jgi:hypothetical protein
MGKVMRQRGPRAPLVATFFAFRAQRGVLLFPATVLYLLGTTAIVAAFLALNGGVVEAMRRGVVAALVVPEVWPSAALALLLQRILAAAWEAGCLRWMILGERGGVFGLSFGAATFRVLAVHLLWAVFFSASGALLYATYRALDWAAGPVDALADSAAWFFRDYAFPAVFALVGSAIAAVAVKLSPAAALTVALDRFAFFAAWRISRSRFFALLGSAVAVPLIAAGAIMVAAAVTTLALSGYLYTVAFSIGVAAAGAWLSLTRFGIAARAVQAAAEETP